MDPIWINAVMLPLFSVALIPTAIRNKETGQYLGFLNSNILTYAIFLLLVQLFFMIYKFGFGMEALIRGIGIAILPFPLGYAYVILTHKELFGKSFERPNKKGD